MKITTEVTLTKVHWDRFNQFKNTHESSIISCDEEISQGLAARLLKYAIGRAKESGLMGVLSNDWSVLVSTNDGDEKPANRYYEVRWTNAVGCYIELTRILTKNGWPFLDHHFEIETNYI